MVYFLFHIMPLLDSPELRFILLSHHPNCEKFENHTLNIRGTRVCIGCLAFYPTFMIVFSSVYFLGFYSVNYVKLIYLGILQSSVLLFNFLGLAKTKITKFITKVILGSGIAFILVGILKSPFILILKSLILAIFFTILMILNYLRVKIMINTCKKCDLKKSSSCDLFYYDML